ncbi:MAG: WhiB family transcriptional regulator [Actinobacteria bacterium]|nr:WhiB family transcriptional regulator [Actinomycetota bacterium]
MVVPWIERELPIGSCPDHRRCAGPFLSLTTSPAAMHTARVNPNAAVALLSAIFTGTPSMSGAACRTRPGLFDDRRDGESADAQQQRLAVALAVCGGCPVQRECATALPVRAPRWGGNGVLAGRVLAR